MDYAGNFVEQAMEGFVKATEGLVPGECSLPLRNQGDETVSSLLLVWSTVDIKCIPSYFIHSTWPVLGPFCLGRPFCFFVLRPLDLGSSSTPAEGHGPLSVAHSRGLLSGAPGASCVGVYEESVLGAPSSEKQQRFFQGIWQPSRNTRVEAGS